MSRTASVSLRGSWDQAEFEGLPLEAESDWRAVARKNGFGGVAGAFAVAIEEEGGGLLLARDAAGERTIFYAPERCAAAEDPRELFGAGFAAERPRLDLASLAAYLSCAYLPGRRTLLEGVREVLPGEVVRIAGDGVASARHWELPPGPRGAAPSESAARGELRGRLEDAVRRRLPEGPVAVSLSGGIDSSLVAALARRFTDEPIEAFSVSFGSAHRNELAWSGKVARHLGISHHVVEIAPEEIGRRLDETIALLGDPNGDPLTVPNLLLFERSAARGHSVLLNGEGGDPLFGGPKNSPMLLASLYGAALAPTDPADAFLRAHEKCWDELEEFLSPDVAAEGRARLRAETAVWFEDARWSGLVERLMAMNLALKGGHHILPKVASLSRPFGIRPRSPLADRAVIELALSLPGELRLAGAREKHILKEAVADLLPPEVIDRPKSGMLVPVEAWFRVADGPLLPLARERILDGLPAGVFRRDALERLLAGRWGGVRPRRGVKIWLLLTLESWIRSTGARPA